MQGIGVKKSWFSQLMALADLHQDIVKAFGHPGNLKQKWGYELQLICKKNPALEAAMLLAAQNIIGLGVPPASVFNKLKNVQVEQKQELIKAPVWITDNRGKKIFRIRYSKSGRAQIAFTRRLSEIQINKLIGSAKNILESEETT
jgi:hypothetical protein